MKRDGTTAPLFAKVKGATHRYLGHVRLDVGRAGAARVKRMIYPAGFRWSKDMKPVVGTDLCMHAHAGFLAHGEIHIEYADGCVVEHKAPQIVAIDPGHDGWVVATSPSSSSNSTSKAIPCSAWACPRHTTTRSTMDRLPR